MTTAPRHVLLAPNAQAWIGRLSPRSRSRLSTGPCATGIPATGRNTQAAAGRRSARVTPHQPQPGPARQRQLVRDAEAVALVEHDVALARGLQVRGDPLAVAQLQPRRDEPRAEAAALARRVDAEHRQVEVRLRRMRALDAAEPVEHDRRAAPAQGAHPAQELTDRDGPAIRGRPDRRALAL